jgi:hypothetical protein
MTKSEADEELKSCCYVSSELKNMMSNIVSRSTPGLFLGNIEFHDGKVTGIARNVDLPDDRSFSFVRSMKNLIPEGENVAIIQRFHNSSDKVEAEYVRITFKDGNGLQISIKTVYGIGTKNMEFTELKETLTK